MRGAEQRVTFGRRNLLKTAAPAYDSASLCGIQSEDRRVQWLIRSTIVAMPWPTPMHMVARP